MRNGHAPSHVILLVAPKVVEKRPRPQAVQVLELLAEVVSLQRPAAQAMQALSPSKLQLPAAQGLKGQR